MRSGMKETTHVRVNTLNFSVLEDYYWRTRFDHLIYVCVHAKFHLIPETNREKTTFRNSMSCV